MPDVEAFVSTNSGSCGRRIKTMARQKAPSPKQSSEQWTPRGCKLLEVKVRTCFMHAAEETVQSLLRIRKTSQYGSVFGTDNGPRSPGRALRPGGLHASPSSFPLRRRETACCCACHLNWPGGKETNLVSLCCILVTVSHSTTKSLKMPSAGVAVV